jgi:GNAT superfamily N-acetyltransferase
MKARVTIRDAQPGDGEGCARAWSDAGRYIHELNPDVGRVPDAQGLVEWFEQALAQGRESNEVLLVAESSDGRVLGFIDATIEPPSPDARWQIQRDLGASRLVIGALAVEEADRRAGVGTALMEAAEERGRAQGAAVALTDTSIRSHLSLPFYENRMGYERRAAILRKTLQA